LNVNAAAAANILRGNDNFLILTHKKPDGDTLGCAAALCLGLRAIGKTAFVLENPETTPRYAPMVAPLYADGNFKPQTVVAVDCASRDILPANAQNFAVDLALDHHPTNTHYAKLSVVAPEEAACASVVAAVLRKLKVAVTPEIATALYVAVSTDTGCFSYDNTNAAAFALAAQCAKDGADITAINREIFRVKTRARIALEGAILGGIEFAFDGRAAIAVITRELILSCGAVEDDLENIAAIPVSIEGVVAAFTIRELEDEPGKFKISVRSAPGFSSSEFAQKFGGGGHAGASGFSKTASVETIKTIILQALTEYFA